MRVVDILRQNSTLSNGRVADLLLNPSGIGGGATVYKFIPTEIVEGIVAKNTAIKGEVEDNVFVVGYLDDNTEFIGQIEEEVILGKNEEIVELKGQEICP